jgi:alpha-N-arabinofuranosidase
MPKASLTINPHFAIGKVDRRLFGSFVEHLGRSVYDGIYEPGHETADEEGFRGDVLELVRELGVSTIRYPGGNFVSGFKWEDSVGPAEDRPTRLDLAWHSVETNEVGLHEFSSWLEKAGSELMLAVNLGTRGVEEALDLLEYANVPSGSTLSDQRRANGREKPFAIKTWCLGNEMDGPWQLGHRSAEDYGKLASLTAKAMRQLDESIELVACGSSNRTMPTFGAWEHTVLKHAYDDIDLISCHAYWAESNSDLESFLAAGHDMSLMIEEVVATADAVKAELKKDKQINISFDEWNVWDIERFQVEDKITGVGNWPKAPRLLEDSYTVVDAVVFGSLIISLINHADRVSSASLAQLVNVIAPIMTEPGGIAWKQTTFFPFAVTSRLAGSTALTPRLTSDTYESSVYGTVNLVDSAVTSDEAGTSVFLVNRSVSETTTVTIDISGLGSVAVVEAVALFDDDIHAANTLSDPERVALRPIETTIEAGTLTIELPPVSWAALRLEPVE